MFSIERIDLLTLVRLIFRTIECACCNRNDQIDVNPIRRIQRFRSNQKSQENFECFRRQVTIFSKYQRINERNFYFPEARIEYVSTTGSEFESFAVSCTWNYLAFAADNVLNLSGFIENQLGQSRRITFECNVKAVASSEKYCLVLLTSGVLYKVEINSLKTTELNRLMIGSEPAPKKKSIFGSASSQNSMNRSSDEKITRIASGRTMSVALSNLNVLYNIPSKTFTFAPHVKIKKMCCGNEHCLILTTNGDVYAFGSSS